MELTFAQRVAMADFVKRQYLYSATWCDKVNKMPDNQLFAVFCRLSAEDKLRKSNTCKNKRYIENPHAENTQSQPCEQLTIWDLMKGDSNETDIHSAV